jgi:hypothetical protein
MAKKTAIRRLAKRLPASIGIEGVSKREDDLYDFGAPPRKIAAPPPKTLKDRIDAVVRGPAKEAEEVIDADTGEVTTTNLAMAFSAYNEASADAVIAPAPPQEESVPDGIGSNHPADPISSGTWTPTNDIGYRQYAESWISNLLDKKSTRFNDEIPLRRNCGVSKETREHLKAMFLAKLDSLPGDDE